jgi:hypothetical protein
MANPCTLSDQCKKLSYGEGFNIINEWLGECNKIVRLDFNVNSKIREGLNGALKKGYFPISFDKLKTECREIYYNLEGAKEESGLRKEKSKSAITTIFTSI